MGSQDYRKQSDELVARCRAVGWDVVKSGRDHWKIDTRRGTVTMSSTPSSNESVKNALAQLRRHGLEELEAKLSVRDERDRQERIAADRRRNDAKLEEIQRVNGQRPDAPLGYVDVNGVQVAITAIAPAMVKTPVMSKAAPLADGEELLLANDTVVYRCVKLGPGTQVSTVKPNDVCYAVFNSALSLRTHISHHTTRALRETADAIDQAKQKREEADNVKKAVAAAQAAVTERIENDVTLEQLKIELTGSLTALVASVDTIGASTIEARNSLLKLVELVQHLKTEVIVQEPDPELVAKAQQFDALSATLKGLIGT